MPAPLTAGRALYALTSIILVGTARWADFSYSHIFNARWPPHAKFHTGHTMSMSMVLSAIGLYLSWRSPSTTAAELSDSWIAMVILDVYWVTQAMAFLYPNTSFVDPEFKHEVPSFPPQVVLEVLCVLLNAVAYRMEKGRLENAGMGVGMKDLKEL